MLLLRFNEAGRKLSLLIAYVSEAGDMLAAWNPNRYPPLIEVSEIFCLVIRPGCCQYK